MKKNIKYLFTILIFAIMFCVTFNNIAIATSWDVAGGFDALAGTGKTGKVGTVTQSILGTVIQAIRIVGTGTAIIMLTYVAIKYMSAAPSEKAEFKKSAVAFIVGAIVLFAASGILTVIQNFATNNIKTSAVS